MLHLREQIRDARHKKATAILEAKARCKRVRLELRDKLRRKRAGILAKLRTVSERERELARKTCKTELCAARKLGESVDARRAELAAEKKFRREMRRIEASNRAAHAEHRRTAREARSESDDEVLGNIPPDYAALWERVKKRIRRTPHMSRTEAFLHYAEEHPNELVASWEDKTDELVRRLEQQEREAARASRRRRLPPAADVDVPF